MNEGFKSNTFLKSILVLVIGAFIFDLFFGFITGSGNYYSFKGLVNELLVLLIKILIVLFLIIVIAVLTKWLKDIYRENINTEALKKISNTPALKMSLMIAVILIGLTFLVSILNSFTLTSNNMNMVGMITGYHNGTNLGLNIVNLIAFLVKLLIVILFILLAFGCFMYIREWYGKMDIRSKTNANRSNIKKDISLSNKTN